MQPPPLHTQDPFLSAKRKDERLGRVPAALRMPKTAAFATITLSLSNLLWDLIVLGYDLLVEAYPHLRIGPRPPLLPPPPPQAPAPAPAAKRRARGPQRRLRFGEGGGAGAAWSPSSEASDEEDADGFVTRITGGAIAVEGLMGRRGGEEEEEVEGEGGEPQQGGEEEEEEEEDEAARLTRRRREVRGRVRQILLINGTAYAASLVFMSLGTWVYPGLGTTIGAILADCTPLLLGL
jgi:hypothetical protein